jgi:zinc protease
MGNGASLGRSSRLYRALVETELASSAGCGYGLMRDPYLFSLSVGLRPNVELAEVERVAFDQIDRMRDEPVSDEEMARALKGLRAQFAYASEGVSNIAYWLGSLATIHTHALYDEFLDRLAAVTTADVQRVARQYLTAENRTVGHFVPKSEGGSAKSEGTEASAAFAPEVERRWYTDQWGGGETFDKPEHAYASSAAASGENTLNFQRRVLPNGIVVLGSERLESASVVLRARLRAGAIFDGEETEGLSRLAAIMLQRGTERQTFVELNERTDSLGASIGAEPGRLVVDLRVRCLVEDFAELTGLLADVIRRPIFPVSELEKVRGQTLTAIMQGDQDTRTVAERGLRKLAYPADHPYSRSITGTKESVPTLDRDALVAFHARHYRPDVLSFSVVGGVPFDEAVRVIEEHFGDWRVEDEAPVFTIPVAAPPAATQREEFTLAGKSQSDISAGHPALPRSHPDYYALDVANFVLGRFGLSGRLGQRIREEQGLAYSTSSSLDGGMGPGLWAARAGVNPANVDKAIESMIVELRRLQDEPVGEDELLNAQDFLTGSLPLALESQDGVARAALDIELYNLGLDYLDRYPAIIRALTREQLQAAAQRHLHPDRLAITVAGPERGEPGAPRAKAQG